ncbi:MAG: polymer-forming cytoskeletal protein [Candidatus Lokiarchaeota archaeon]|nr:polymer-forming cytoskeletal protein [Candidatus Lokiarchaeota archaeon]
MKISGSGRLSGMKLNDTLVVSGFAKIDGNFECEGFRSSGSMRAEGDLTVNGDVKSSGSFRLSGNLEVKGNAKFSGSTTIGQGIKIGGGFGNSGSLRAGDKIEADQGIRLSGSTRVEGGLFSQETIEIEGSTTINGDINANEVLIGTKTVIKGKRIAKHPYIVSGSIYGANTVDIKYTIVDGDVKGRHVIIGKRAEVVGNVYYIDSIDVDDKAFLTNVPIQISEINKDRIEK